MNIYKNPLFYLSLILAVIVGLQTWSLVQAGTFVEPTSAFPTSDVSAPVDTGEVAQTKYEKLSFAPIGAPSDVRVSVGLSGLCLDNGGSPGCATTWGIAKGFVRVWQDASGDIYYNTGNVGIGTDNPGSYKLKVDGDVNITGDLTVSGDILFNTVSGNCPAGYVALAREWAARTCSDQANCGSLSGYTCTTDGVWRGTGETPSCSYRKYVVSTGLCPYTTCYANTVSNSICIKIP